jgi:hypothetical protein
MKSSKILWLIAAIVLLGALLWLLFGYLGIQALLMNKTVDEAVPSVVTSLATQPAAKLPAGLIGPLIIADGEFEQGDSTYQIEGKATITEENGKRTLSLTDFDVTNGPDLYVYLVRSPNSENQAVKDAVGAGNFVSLATLKGNKGNQMYEVPADIELNDGYVVSIWCKRFFRNFGSAELNVRMY